MKIFQHISTPRLFISIFTTILCSFLTESKGNNVIKLGAMFSSANLTMSFKNRLQTINENLTSINASLQFSSVTDLINGNPIQAALDVCEKFLNEQVLAVFVSEDNLTNDAVLGISYTCGFFEVPVVGIAVREAIFSDRVSSNSRVQLVKLFYARVDLWWYLFKTFITQFTCSAKLQLLNKKQMYNIVRDMQITSKRRYYTMH